MKCVSNDYTKPKTLTTLTLTLRPSRRLPWL